MNKRKRRAIGTPRKQRRIFEQPPYRKGVLLLSHPGGSSAVFSDFTRRARSPAEVKNPALCTARTTGRRP